MKLDLDNGDALGCVWLILASAAALVVVIFTRGCVTEGPLR